MKKIATLTLAIAAFAALGGVAIASVLQAAPDDGISTSSAKVPSGYSGINDKALQACLDSQAVCNPAAKSANKQVWESPLAAGQSTLARADIEQLIRKNMGIASSTPVFTAEMSGSQAESAVGMSRGKNIDASRPVWIVTVNTPMYTDGGPNAAPKLMHSYSAIIDAASGQVTDDCIGCTWLTSSK